MKNDRASEAPGSYGYEAPRIRDLEELGLSGQFPLGTDTCSVGSGDYPNICYNGSGSGVCESGLNG